MTQGTSTVIILDGDISSCRSTERLVLSLGPHMQAMIFHSPTALLRRPRPEPPACMVLEVRLPGLSGLKLQQELAQTGIEIPLIFITEHGDIPMAVQAMKAGAIDFLTKPFCKQDLIDDLGQAFQRDQAACERQRKVATWRERYDLLTPCERRVMTRVIAGLPNKETAAELGITEKTVKFHRGHIMRKMQAWSAIELALMAEQMELLPTPASSKDRDRGLSPACGEVRPGPVQTAVAV